MLTFNNISYVSTGGTGVFNITEKKVVPVHKVKDGTLFFIVRGEKEVVRVNLALFVLHSFEKFHLPFSEWSKVYPGFLDDDPSNLDPENIYPIYPGEGIPYPGKEGYFYIPSFELNAINKKGRVYRSKRCSFYPKGPDDIVMTGGYPISKLDVVSGDQRKYLHRLLAVTFKNPPKGYPLLLVDHDNGDKCDFSLNNLFWVTPSENIKKAYYDQGLRDDNHPIVVFDRETGQTMEYVAKSEFARLLGIDPWGISLVMKRERTVYKERYVIKEKADTRTFKEIFDIVPAKIETVKARNVFTGVVTLYSSLREAEKNTKVSDTKIKEVIRANKVRGVYKELQFKDGSDDSPWEELNEYELECVRRGMQLNSSVYELTNIVSGEKTICYGNEEVASFTGANTRTVINAFKKGELLLKKYMLKKLTR